MPFKCDEGNDWFASNWVADFDRSAKGSGIELNFLHVIYSYLSTTSTMKQTIKSDGSYKIDFALIGHFECGTIQYYFGFTLEVPLNFQLGSVNQLLFPCINECFSLTNFCAQTFQTPITCITCSILFAFIHYCIIDGCNIITGRVNFITNLPHKRNPDNEKLLQYCSDVIFTPLPPAPDRDCRDFKALYVRGS